ncbi:MAG: hypothetical protein N2117_10825 [Anaerolineales bacterium]|nr:hypothetical protein [Anaerolineales bacterium]MCX7755719.1 hypothetical protein [Anaerolineales bacterium]MDW8277680.1 hypothetical protein [Anaerolineales bacterium]
MPSPRVLLSIDYEPWFALSRRYDTVRDPALRRALDGGFTHQALDPLLEQLDDTRASFYLVGEIVDWYPDVPQKIIQAGHELGLHCQIHRPLVNERELAEDLAASAGWRAHYNVLGYRAPMVGISEAAYPLLKRAGFLYSSSIYAPSGNLHRKNGLWELPVSTLSLLRTPSHLSAPRQFSPRLLAAGEVPYGSSFMIGLMPGLILKIIERELRAGFSPVIILHPYELIRPERFLRRLGPDLAAYPLLLPFTLDKSTFLKTLRRHFPISPLLDYVRETAQATASEPIIQHPTTDD